MAVAKALGAARVIAIDIAPSRLDFAKNYAATDVFLPPTANPNESGLEYSKRCADTMMKEFCLRERGGVSVVDVVVDASGAEPSIQTALHMVKVGGTFVQVRPAGYLVLPVRYRFCTRSAWELQPSRYL